MNPGIIAVYAALTLLALAGWVGLRARRRRCALYHVPGPRGRALRIGISNDPDRREDEYARTAWWWYQRTGPLTVRRWYRDEVTAHRAEILAIGRERPPHNDRHNPDRRRGHAAGRVAVGTRHRPPVLDGPVDGRRVRADRGHLVSRLD